MANPIKAGRRSRITLSMLISVLLVATGAVTGLRTFVAAPNHGSVGPLGRRAGLQIAPDLNDRLSKWRVVTMPFESSHLNSKERRLVSRLADASQYLDDIYWRQSDPEGLAIYKSLKGSRDPEALRLLRMLVINGSRY